MVRVLKFKDQLTKQQYQDLCDFEGNANGFKILTENKVRDSRRA